MSFLPEYIQIPRLQIVLYTLPSFFVFIFKSTGIFQCKAANYHTHTHTQTHTHIHKPHKHTHSHHTHTYMYIYIYIYMYVCQNGKTLFKTP